MIEIPKVVLIPQIETECQSRINLWNWHFPHLCAMVSLPISFTYFNLGVCCHITIWIRRQIHALTTISSCSGLWCFWFLFQFGFWEGCSCHRLVIKTLPIVIHVLLVINAILYEMWIQENKLIILKTNKVERGIRSSTHSANEYIRLRENVSNGLYVAWFDLVHPDPTGYNDEAAISELSFQSFIAFVFFL